MKYEVSDNVRDSIACVLSLFLDDTLLDLEERATASRKKPVLKFEDLIDDTIEALRLFNDTDAHEWYSKAFQKYRKG